MHPGGPPVNLSLPAYPVLVRACPACGRIDRTRWVQSLHASDPADARFAPPHVPRHYSSIVPATLLGAWVTVVALAWMVSHLDRSRRLGLRRRPGRAPAPGHRLLRPRLVARRAPAQRRRSAQRRALASGPLLRGLRSSSSPTAWRPRPPAAWAGGTGPARGRPPGRELSYARSGLHRRARRRAARLPRSSSGRARGGRRDPRLGHVRQRPAALPLAASRAAATRSSAATSRAAWSPSAARARTRCSHPTPRASSSTTTAAAVAANTAVSVGRSSACTATPCTAPPIMAPAPTSCSCPTTRSSPYQTSSASPRAPPSPAAAAPPTPPCGGWTCPAATRWPSSARARSG